MSIKRIKYNRGSLLIEVLVSIALFMAISTIITQAMFASFYSGKESKNKITINNLLTEQLVKIRAISSENWNNIGGLTRNTNYYIDSQVGAFSVFPGTASGTINDLAYNIFFQVSDGARIVTGATSSMSYESSSSTKADPATLIITSTGIYGSSSPIIIKSTITRWRNIICSQSDWGATSSSATIPCETTLVGGSQKVNIAAGSELKLCNGCN